MRSVLFRGTSQGFYRYLKNTGVANPLRHKWLKVTSFFIRMTILSVMLTDVIQTNGERPTPNDLRPGVSQDRLGEKGIGI